MTWNMIGHEWAVELLQAHIANHNIRHAYLITGPEGVGRRTLALSLAQALNCTQPPAPGQPCNACQHCRRFRDMSHPDLSTVQSDQEGGTLKVDQIRDLQHTLSLTPYEARYRIALLLRFEEAHISAQNALLKTLEEPSPQVIMILTAVNAEILLPTIVSRCEVLRLRPLPLEKASLGLQAHWDISEEQATRLAHLSGGCPGLAMKMHVQPDVLEQRQNRISDLYHMLSTGRVERFAYADHLSKDKSELRNIIAAWVSFWRDILIATSGSSVPFTNLDWTTEIEKLATYLNIPTVNSVLLRLEQTMNAINQNINPRLALEVLMLDFPFFENKRY